MQYVEALSDGRTKLENFFNILYVGHALSTRFRAMVQYLFLLAKHGRKEACIALFQVTHVDC